MLALHAYNKAKKDPEHLERVLFSIKQQAGVVGAFCMAIFGVISALQSAKMSYSAATAGGGSVTGIQFGKRSSERAEQPD